MILNFPTGQYDIIYMDIPWPHYGDKNKNAAAGKHYDLMTMEEIYSLPVPELMHKNSALFMWATCPRLNLAFDVIREWKLHYRGVVYIWAKVRKDGNLIHGQGVPPTFTKPTSELLLGVTKCKTGRPFKILTKRQPQIILASRTKVHSEKPAIFRDKIIELCGDRSRIELFSRHDIPGWDRWGDGKGMPAAQEVSIQI